MRLLLIPLFGLLAACDGHYRYPCQDPANWDKLECNNEVCKAEGSCTEDVLGRNYTPPPTSSDIEQENTTEEPNIVSSDTECKPEVRTVIKEVVKTVEPEGQESLERDVVSEEPLTMNSVVDTADHNSAAR